MKDLHAIKGRYHIQQLVDEGEHVHQDFKYTISDARKIARSLSAFANNDGGRLLIGVKDNGVIAGVRNEEDIYVVEQAARMYCVPAVEVRFEAYRTEPGVTVIKASIDAAPPHVRPVCVREADGRPRAYYRVDDENIAAHPLMVAAWRLGADPGRSPDTFTLDAATSAVLTAIDAASNTGADPARIAIDAHVASSTATRIITRLAAAGIVSFVYSNHSFRLVRT